MQVGKAQFATLHLKTLSEQVGIKYQCFCFFRMFIFIFGLSTWLVHSLVIRSNGETHRNYHFSRQKNDVIFDIFNQIIVSRVPWPIRHCHLCIKVQLEITRIVPLTFYHVHIMFTDKILIKKYLKSMLFV